MDGSGRLELREEPAAIVLRLVVALAIVAPIGAMAPRLRVICAAIGIAALAHAVYASRRRVRARADPAAGALELDGVRHALDDLDAVSIDAPDPEAPGTKVVVATTRTGRTIPLFVGRGAWAEAIAGFAAAAIARRRAVRRAPVGVAITEEALEAWRTRVIAARARGAPGERVVALVRQTAPNDAPQRPLPFAEGTSTIAHYVACLDRISRGDRRGLRAVTRVEARAALAERLEHELAYGGRVVADKGAAALVDALFARLGEDVRFHVAHDAARMSRKASFDAGIVAESTNVSLLVWLESDSPGR